MIPHCKAFSTVWPPRRLFGLIDFLWNNKRATKENKENNKDDENNDTRNGNDNHMEKGHCKHS